MGRMTTLLDVSRLTTVSWASAHAAPEPIGSPLPPLVSRPATFSWASADAALNSPGRFMLLPCAPHTEEWLPSCGVCPRRLTPCPFQAHLGTTRVTVRDVLRGLRGFKCVGYKHVGPSTR